MFLFPLNMGSNSSRKMMLQCLLSYWFYSKSGATFPWPIPTRKAPGPPGNAPPLWGRFAGAGLPRMLRARGTMGAAVGRVRRTQWVPECGRPGSAEVPASEAWEEQKKAGCRFLVLAPRGSPGPLETKRGR